MVFNSITAPGGVTAALYELPVADHRLDGMAVAPADAMALVQYAIDRADELAALIRQSAPAPEVTAAAEAVAAIRAPLKSMELIVGALIEAYRAGSAQARAASPASRPRLSAVPAGNDTPGGAA